MKRALIIQHTAVDSPGMVQEFLDDSGTKTEIIRIDKGDQVPKRVSADVLFSFGGPVSLHHQCLPDWVDDERNLMTRYLTEGNRVMGVCLGAQMLASSLGASTHPNVQREVGWFPITSIGNEFFSLPKELMVLHWHQNTFDLPENAAHLFRSEACRNQGFSITDQAIGLQFHPEATKKTIKYFLAVSGLCRKPYPHVQSTQDILLGMEQHLETQHAWLRTFLRGWLTPAPKGQVSPKPRGTSFHRS